MVKIKRIPDHHDIYYAIVVLNSMNPESSVLRAGLIEQYPEHVIEWLEKNRLLVSTNFRAEGRVIEKRTVLGRRALSMVNTNWKFQIDALMEINKVNG